jgi:hypothetical protein
MSCSLFARKIRINDIITTNYLHFDHPEISFDAEKVIPGNPHPNPTRSQSKKTTTKIIITNNLVFFHHILRLPINICLNEE